MSKGVHGVMRLLTAILLGMLLACGLTWFFSAPLTNRGQAASGARYVDLNGVCGGYQPCHQNIGDAVTASEPGDVIVVFPGTYTENVAVDKVGLTIQSKDGDQSTVVQAANNNISVFNILTESVTIAGFTIRNASVASAGINVDANHARIFSNTITGNWKGIQIWDGSHILIQANDISDNRANSFSDGVYILWGNHLTLTNNIISNNSDEGIQLEVGSSERGEFLHIYTSEIISNGGEGIYFGSSDDLIISNTTIISSGMNGVYAPNSDNLTMEDCTIAGNQAYGVHSTYGQDIAIQNCTIANNLAGGLLFETGDTEIPDDWGDAFEFKHNYSLVGTAVTGNGGDGVNWGEMPISGTIVGNLISANLGHGLVFGGRRIDYYIYPGPIYMGSLFSSEHLVAGNNILDNDQIGIYLRHWAGDNDIFLNNFIGNGTNSDLIEPWEDNRWHSGMLTYTYNWGTFSSFLGNHWDDYQGPDGDQNGIGDPPFPYVIDPQADFFPLIVPFENYLQTVRKIYLPLVKR